MNNIDLEHLILNEKYKLILIEYGPEELFRLLRWLQFIGDKEGVVKIIEVIDNYHSSLQG